MSTLTTLTPATTIQRPQKPVNQVLPPNLSPHGGGLPQCFPLQPHSPQKSKGGFFKHCESSQVSLLLKTLLWLPATFRMKHKLLAQLSQHSVTCPQGHSPAQPQGPPLTRPPHEQWQASAYRPPLTSHLPAPTALQPRQPPFCSSTCQASPVAGPLHQLPPLPDLFHNRALRGLLLTSHISTSVSYLQRDPPIHLTKVTDPVPLNPFIVL